MAEETRKKQSVPPSLKGKGDRGKGFAPERLRQKPPLSLRDISPIGGDAEAKAGANAAKSVPPSLKGKEDRGKGSPQTGAVPKRAQKPVSARDAALKILIDCRDRNAWTDAALQGVSLPPADAALCSRLVYGVTQNQTLLDFYLDAFCTQRTSHLQCPLAEIMRLGAYQILFLDRVPDHAAVDEAVKQAIRAGRKSASGMVNAVLRRLSREKASLPQIPGADPLRALSIRYSHPRWIVERVCGLLGIEETERFLSENNKIPPLMIQVNPERATPETLITELASQGVKAARNALIADCLELSDSGAVGRLAAFRAGKFYAQDAAARLVTEAAAIRPGQSVLDVCAAPGGKSFSAAFAAGDSGFVLACDVSADRLKRVTDGAKRLGLAEKIKTAVADGREFHEEWAAKFDVALVDAPCSGLGVIRKKPDIRYRDPAPLEALPELQGAILDNAAQYVRPGGTLIYSTCTILPEENEGVTQGFLSAHGDFRKTPFVLPGIGEASGDVTLWPQKHGTDGFYICRMERNAQ